MSERFSSSANDSLIVPYRPGWVDDFQREADRLMALGIPGLVCHHIGSTAVPGLMAKPCIDILGVVSDLEVIQNRADDIVSLGYEDRGAYGITGRRYFSMPKPKVHLHIFAQGHPAIEQHLAFVRELNSSPDLVQQLNALKQSLVERFPDDKAAYQSGKAEFYERLLKSKDPSHE